MWVFKVGLLVYRLILASFFYSVTTVVEMIGKLFLLHNVRR